MGDEVTWDDYIQSQMVDYGGVSQACILSCEDGVTWASTEGFQPTVHIAEVNQEDGSTSQQEINEAALLVKFVASGRKPSEGFWINGVKYMVLRTIQNESPRLPGETIFVVYGKKPAGGICMAKSKSTIVIGTFDEGRGQSAGLCNQIVIRIATWLAVNQF
uniref:Profilin n=1 Tax=Octactis speculum TaxID=3111310 RepID=A0A7S2CIS5_9STRA|mmetsp:Transcript_36697/g.49642  ORF Transcript_36697/g.49642 Transcript_36697/m.49642 type:complete len:161 (+) Transcript_36697:147-629(+)